MIAFNRKLIKDNAIIALRWSSLINSVKYDNVTNWFHNYLFDHYDTKTILSSRIRSVEDKSSELKQYNSINFNKNHIILTWCMFRVALQFDLMMYSKSVQLLAESIQTVVASVWVEYSFRPMHKEVVVTWQLCRDLFAQHHTRPHCTNGRLTSIRLKWANRIQKLYWFEKL
jgi:hypothetical protein